MAINIGNTTIYPSEVKNLILFFLNRTREVRTDLSDYVKTDEAVLHIEGNRYYLDNFVGRSHEFMLIQDTDLALGLQEGQHVRVYMRDEGKRPYDFSFDGHLDSLVVKQPLTRSLYNPTTVIRRIEGI
jgi:hypothetical protein